MIAWARSTTLSYAIAVVGTAAVALLCELLRAWLGNNLPCLIFLAAVVASAWKGNWGPGLLATAISVFAISFLIFEPRFSLAIEDPAERFELVLFIVAAVVTNALLASREFARHRSAVLEEADRNKDQFLATLAHELRNPLATIRTALQLQETSRDREMIEKAIRMMERQVQQMVRLVDDLMDVSRVTRGRLLLVRERVELATVVQTAVDSARPLVEAAGHTLTVTVPAEPIHLDADAGRLVQVFSNLLSNSARYTERGGRITLTVRCEGAEAVVAVCDNGIGIRPEILPHIFDLFTQADATSERARAGLGLGLSLARRLVELHGGTIRAASAGPGRGSEFTIRLPIADSAPPASPADRSRPSIAPLSQPHCP